jgi:uncharacterized membrane protein
MRLQCSIDFGEFPFYEPQELVHIASLLSPNPQTASPVGVLSLKLVKFPANYSWIHHHCDRYISLSVPTSSLINKLLNKLGLTHQFFLLLTFYILKPG